MTRFLSCLFLFFLSANSQPSFSDQQISPLIHQQALSHIAFHSNPLKLALASLFSPRTISIVGVEWGADLILFAENNYTVYAFEPVKKFVSHLESIVARNPHWNVSLIPIAAGKDSEGTIQLNYDNADVSETVPVGRVDHYVHDPLGVFSLDIQGEEFHVLEGSTGLLESSSPPSSLWIEAIACNPKVSQILEMLKGKYIFFDFAPWGKHKADDTEGVPLSLQSFLFKPGRPGRFDDFLHWMCEEQKQNFKWLQTDLLAVRKDLLTGDMVEKLSSLAQYCKEGTGVNCKLYSLLSATNEIDEKEEL